MGFAHACSKTKKGVDSHTFDKTMGQSGHGVLLVGRDLTSYDEVVCNSSGDVLLAYQRLFKSCLTCARTLKPLRSADLDIYFYEFGPIHSLLKSQIEIPYLSLNEK